MRRRRSRLAVLAVVIGGVLALPVTANARPIPASAFDHTQNMHPLGASPFPNTPSPFTANSDLALWGDLAFPGHYDGFRILDVSAPANPRLQECFGDPGDVVVDGDILVRSWNSPAPAGTTCDGDPVLVEFEGLHVFDISDLTNPDLVASVETECGSHTAKANTDPTGHPQPQLVSTSGGVEPAATCADYEVPRPQLLRPAHPARKTGRLLTPITRVTGDLGRIHALETMSNGLSPRVGRVGQPRDRRNVDV